SNAPTAGVAALSANWSSDCKTLCRLAVLRTALLPLLPVERGDGEGGHGGRVDAARVDTDSVGVGARHIERLDAAGGTKIVLCDVGVERVRRERVLTLEELEALGGHDQMQIARLGANGAVALGDAKLGGRLHLEAHPAAVTAARVNDQGHRG